jgi:glycerol-3-phosphate dehydrogenase
MHGLLHSGARYAVTDPQSARDCIEENQVLREIAGHTVEDFGGLFVDHPEDPEDYFARKREACEEVGIPVEELSGEAVREVEPGVSEAVQRGLRVPDAAVDPFRLTAATARAAQNHGAAVISHAEVINVLVEDGAVTGVRVREHDPTEEGESVSPGDVVDIDADYVVNAAGAWVDEIAKMARLEVSVRRSKGAMAVTAGQPVETVVNRCRPRGQGDILVPHGDVSILGTTDVAVEDPEEYEEEGWELDLLVEELAPVVPAVADARIMRSYWGVRPLYEPPGDESEDSTDLTREYVVLDHEQRDDTWGMSTVVGGKLTTHRLMAESVADHVCEKFGIRRPCRTDEIPLPGSDSEESLQDAMAEFDLESPTYEQTKERLGARAPEVLDTNGPNPVVCPCRGVTAAELQTAIDDESVLETDLNDLRIRTGVGTGTCQGMRCCHRVAAELHPYRNGETVDRALEVFYQERFKGGRHTLWGEQLSRAMTGYALHATTMNRDAAPERDQVDVGAFDDGPEFDDDVEPEGGFGGFA